jgi:hypothetical protein
MGRLTFIGSLADGTKISQATFLSRNGRWPLYITPYSGMGYLFSWATFNSTTTGDLGGPIYWSKPGTNGFSVLSEVIGSVYHHPGPGGSILDFSDGTIAVSGGDLSQNFQGQVHLGPNGAVTSPAGLRLKLKFALSTGTFQGSVVEPGSNRLLPFHGVALQKQKLGAGYFTGVNASGEVVVQP